MEEHASAPTEPGPSASDRPPIAPSSDGDVSPSTRAARQRILPIPAPSQRALLVVGAAIIAGVVLWMGREVLSPFVVGLLLVYLLNPIVDRLARFGLPRWASVLLVYLVGGFVLVEVVALTLGPLVAQVSDLVEDMPQLSSAVSEQLDRLGQIYRGLELPEQLRESIDEALTDLGSRLGGLVSGLMVPVFSSVAAMVGSLFGYIVVPVWVFYLLRDRRELTAALDRSLPAEWREDVWTLGRIVRRVFSQWIRAQVILGVTVGLAIFIGLLVLGAVVDPIFSRFALFLALIAGLLELLPIIGPIIAAVPAILLAATAGLDAVVAAFALYLIVQQVENTVLVPKIQGDAVELHPSMVIFSLIIGGAIAGLLGAILALPIAATARNVYRYLYHRLEPNPESPAIASRGLDGRHRPDGVERPPGSPADAAEPGSAADAAEPVATS